MYELKNPKKISNTCLPIKKDLNEILNFDPSVNNFWE